MFIGALGFGIRGEIISGEIYQDHPDIKNRLNGNLVAIPIPHSLHPLPGAGGVKYRVGEVLCETFLAWNKKRQEECPR